MLMRNSRDSSQPVLPEMTVYSPSSRVSCVTTSWPGAVATDTGNKRERLVPGGAGVGVNAREVDLVARLEVTNGVAIGRRR